MKGFRRLAAAVALALLAPLTVGGTSPSTVAAATDCVGLCAGGEFHPLDMPTRLTRLVGAGFGQSVIPPVDLLRLAGSSWLPAGQGIVASDVLAVLASVTVQSPSVAGSLLAYPDTRTTAPAVVFAAGQTVTNTAVLRADSSGFVRLELVPALAGAAGTATVSVEIVGWWSTSTYGAGTPSDTSDERGARLVAAGPKHLLDTRNGSLADTPLVAGGTRDINLAWLGADVTAVMVNITAFTPTVRTFLSALPGAGPLAGTPTARSMSADPSRNTSLLVAVKLDANKTFRIYNYVGQVNVLVDLWAVFRTGTDVTTTAGRVVPLARPFRVLDTASKSFGAVALGPGQAEDWSFAAFANSVTLGGVAVGAQTGLLGNFTNTSMVKSSPTSATSGWLTVYPPRATPPNVVAVSTLVGRASSSLALFNYGPNAVSRVYNRSGYSHYQLDVSAVVLG